MTLSLPEVGEKNTTADPKIREILVASKEGLESYRTLLLAQQSITSGATAGTYMFSGTTDEKKSGETSGKDPVPYFYFDDADFLATGVTQKLRLRVQAACNATKAAIKFTVGLYPLTVAGGASELKFTLGTVVTGSAVEVNEPAASTITSAVSSDFTIPADGAYGLGVVTGGTMTTNSVVILAAQLQTESV